jgi:hypothetical protein
VALATVDLATTRLSFVENKRLEMAYNTSGWTLVVLISRMLSSLRQLLTRCSAGIEMRRNAMCTSRMCQPLAMTQMFRQSRAHENRLSGIVGGSLEAGRFKNLLLQR